MSSPATESASPGPYERPVAIVGVISVGHFLSHFYYLVLPPLFPLMKEGLGVDYTSLGLAITALSAMSAIAQAPVGFIVDRYDPPSVLLVGLVLSSLAIMCVGLFPHYGALIACMFVFGLGDSVFHPADFTILTRSINPIQMGRAFSVHAFAGHLGFAAAPGDDHRTCLLVRLADGAGDFRSGGASNGGRHLLLSTAAQPALPRGHPRC